MRLTTDDRMDGGWRMATTAAGAWPTAADIDDGARWLATTVPTTVAATLEAHGLFDRTAPEHLADRDHWFVTDLFGPAGPATLVLDGLATIAEVWLDDALVLSSNSMFAAHEVAVTLSGANRLAIAFRALDPHLDVPGPRARWRPQMITPQGLRMVRTTLLGHMPGWCPNIDAIGPYRPVSLRREADITIEDLVIRAGFDEAGHGDLLVSFVFSGRAGALSVACAGTEVPVLARPDGRLAARLSLPGIEPWWPNGMGEPNLHDVVLIADGVAVTLGRTGFRTIGLDTGADGRGFALVVNGVPVFCRGAVWTNADIVSLPGDRESYRPFLVRAAEANMNMIRIGGTMTYESAAFFALCDELGLMVWQDAMLANFDYPAGDEALVAAIGAEIAGLLKASQASPSLAVFCGGSEMAQQAAMLGLPERMWYSPIVTETIPAVVEELRPDIITVPNSPFGGPMPFSPDTSVTHYYGVGAYCRPLEDARRANVRFASECLAFAHVPEQETLDTHLPVPAVHDPRWKARVPRDRGASWDFEDIRDHYLGLLHGVDPARLRREDPLRYLDLSRAVTGQVIETVVGEWRRPGSTARGSLVWTLQDLLPGAGWGVIDATGRPKPVWHALRRGFRPVQVILTDEGTNGLDVHLVNETPHRIEAVLTLSALRQGRTRVVGGDHALTLEPFSATTFAATTLFGAFFDTTYAFRFGPPSHDVTLARLVDSADSRTLSEAFHYPLGRPAASHRAVLTARLEQAGHDWTVHLAADCLAQGVHLAAEGYLPSDNWFDLPPGHEVVIRLASSDGRDGRPTVEIGHLGSPDLLRL